MKFEPVDTCAAMVPGPAGVEVLLLFLHETIDKPIIKKKTVATLFLLKNFDCIKENFPVSKYWSDE